MISIRKARDRGHFDHGWLDTHHTFSFGDYEDPRHMGFRSLRVINEDFVQPGRGFPTHGHRDMEIVTYVLDGTLAHKDSLGTGSTITPGEVQRMSAGTGIMHSEFNHSQDEIVHLLQIWILPERQGLKPGYEQKAFTDDERRGVLRLVASRDGSQGSVTVHQDMRLYASLLDAGTTVEHSLAPGRHAWIQVARGTVALDDQPLAAGDGAAVSDATSIRLTGTSAAEVLVFDLA